MAIDDAVVTLLVMLAITSSVTSVGLYHSPDDVSQLMRHDDDIRSQSRHAAAAAGGGGGGESEDVMVRRTPGWGKRRDHDLPFQDKRRGWGKRDVDTNCGYWQSLLQFINVSVDSIFFY